MSLEPPTPPGANGSIPTEEDRVLDASAWSPVAGAPVAGAPVGYRAVGYSVVGDITDRSTWAPPVKPRSTLRSTPVGQTISVVIAGVVLVAGSFGASLAFFSPHSKNGHDPARTLSSTTSATLEKVAKGAEASTVTIDSLFGLSGDGGAGTGVIVSRSGLVVTNNHVIEGATRVEVRTADGVVHSASILGYDTRHDLALLQLRGARDLFVARTSVYFSVGDSVVGVGNLGGGGVLRASQGSITDVGSIIIARDKLNGSKEILRGLIGTSAAIGAGDSGGPLLTTSGKVVGIDVAGVVTRAGGGYAIPISDVTRFVAMVLAGDFVDGVHARSTAFVGVFTRASKDKVGVVVLGVSAHSAGAGVLVRGDVITRLGSAVITSAASLTDAVLRDVPGQRVILGWNSATGVAHTAAIVLGSGPPQ